MRVAALYDVHGMPWALEAVLAEVDADAIVLGGDYLYGPYPREIVAMIRGLDAHLVRGNCEDMAEEWEISQLDPADLAWLQGLPLSVTVDGVLYCHAAPDDHMPITTAATPDDAIRKTFAGRSGTIVIGHTHHQFDRTVGDLRIVNAGSVGMAYEDDVAAYWTLVEDGEPRPMRTAFDVERAIRETRASGWPHAQEFAAENLEQAQSRDEAIAALESRRT
ncbi:MAG TPA: metallophosphoesterase family protein [Gaiellaceae bacterium]|nr:metallophosphoesterase family protein [Gaiellaceae bacterium]